MKIFETKAALVAATLTAGQIVETKGYTTSGDGGAGRYLVKTAAQATADGDVIDGYGNHTLANGNVAIIQIDGWANILKFGAVDDTGVDSAPSIQAALDSFDQVLVPKGIFRIDSTLSMTRSNQSLRGTSWVGSILLSGPSVTAFSPNNAFITVDVQPLNGSIENLRFNCGGAYTGWAIMAGASQNGFNGFSIQLNKIWYAPPSSAAGFYVGGLYDCLVSQCQFENVKQIFSLPDGCSRGLITEINALDTRTNFIRVLNGSRTYGMKISNIISSVNVGNAVDDQVFFADIDTATDWDFTDITFGAGSSFDPDPSYQGFIRAANCTNLRISNCDVETYSVTGTFEPFAQVRGLDFTSCSVIVENVELRDDADRGLQAIRIEGADNDIKLSNVRVRGGKSGQILFTGAGGKFEASDCLFTKGLAQIVNMSGTNTIDFKFRDSTLINPYWGSVAAGTYAFVVSTTGEIVFLNNIMGRDAEGAAANQSNPEYWFYFTNASSVTGSVSGNEFNNLTMQKLFPTFNNGKIPCNLKLYDAALADEATLFLPSGSAGVVNVYMGTEAGTFLLDTGGGSTKISGTTNTINTNTDTNLCVFVSSGIPRISNRLGAAKETIVNYEFYP